ncbi:hypothetical protein EAF00_004161 [Botryotinia globosa]|nr:hypothetical protein EAF00_004161 [Botryotinia globosa]
MVLCVGETLSIVLDAFNIAHDRPEDPTWIYGKPAYRLQGHNMAGRPALAEPLEGTLSRFEKIIFYECGIQWNSCRKKCVCTSGHHVASRMCDPGEDIVPVAQYIGAYSEHELAVFWNHRALPISMSGKISAHSPKI